MALEATLGVHRFDLLDKGALPKARDLLMGYAAAGGDLNQLYPNTNYPTPVWMSWLLANEAVFHSDSDDAKRQRQQTAFSFIKELGAKPVYKRFRGGSTVFSTALRHGAWVTIALLMEEGFDLSLEKKPPVLQLLNVMSIRYRDSGAEALLTLLLQRGASPDQGSDDGVDYPLTVACSKSLPACVDLLLQRDANPNIVDKYGATPIMHCIDNVLSGERDLFVRANQPEIVELLLRAGAHVNARTTQNRTFHSMVERACHDELKATLFALVEQYLGHAGKKQVPAKKAAAAKAPQLLSEEQIQRKKDIPHGGKQTEVAWILACFRENGITDFAAGSLSQAFTALKIDRYGEGSIVKCSTVEAEKILTKMTKRKASGLVMQGEQFRLV